MDWPEAVRKGEAWAAGLNAVLAVGLWLTRKWWRMPAEAGRESPAPVTAREKSPRWWLAALIGCVIVCGAVRWNFSHRSLWWDEMWNAREATVGEFRPDKKHPGAMKFHPSTWSQALWNFRKPTNHSAFTVLSKACHEAWAAIARPPAGVFSEFVLRLPNFLLSMATVWMVGWLLRAWGYPSAGLLAALWLAIHPWFIRYGVDGRAYTLLTALTAAQMHVLWRLIGRDPAPWGARARWWWVFGLLQGWIVWANVWAVWLAGAFFAVAAAAIFEEWPKAVRWQGLRRLAGVNIVGAMIFLQLFLPNLLQLVSWDGRNADGQLLSASVLNQTLQLATLGVTPALFHQPDDALIASATRTTSIATPAMAVVLILAAFGVARLLREKRWACWSAVSVLAGAAAFLLIGRVTGQFFYPRFIVPVVVPLVILASLGLRGRLALAFCVPLLGVLWIAAAGVDVFQRRPYAPLRDVAAFLQQQPPGAIHIGYGLGGEMLAGYWPNVVPVKKELGRPEVDAALATGKTVYVAVGYNDLNRQKMPDGFVLLDDRRRFEEIAVFHGIEPDFTFRVLRSVSPPK